MRTLPDLGALLLAAVLLMGPQVPAQASSPAPAPSASLTTAPQVQEWISSQGQDMIRQEIAQDASAGSPVNVETWSDGVLDATDLEDPTDPTNTWAAVISTAEGPVGVLVVEADGSEPSAMVQRDPELAAALTALPERAIVLREPAPPSAAAAASPTPSPLPSPGTTTDSAEDPAATAQDDADGGGADDGADTYADIADPAASDAWYALTDDVVTALDEQAAAGLAGPVGLSAYAQVLHDRAHGIVDTDKTDTRKGSHTLDLAIVYTGVGVLAIGAVIVTTTFVHERRVMAPLRESPDSRAAEDADRAP